MGNGGAMASRGWYGVLSVLVYKNASPVGEFEADLGSQDQFGPPPSPLLKEGEFGGTSLKM